MSELTLNDIGSGMFPGTREGVFAQAEINPECSGGYLTTNKEQPCLLNTSISCAMFYLWAYFSLHRLQYPQLPKRKAGMAVLVSARAR
jgi:hypothetical protein